MKKVGEKLKRIRESINLSYEDVALMVGESPGYIEYAENAMEEKYAIEVIRKMNDVFNTPLYYPKDNEVNDELSIEWKIDFMKYAAQFIKLELSDYNIEMLISIYEDLIEKRGGTSFRDIMYIWSKVCIRTSETTSSKEERFEKV